MFRWIWIYLGAWVAAKILTAMGKTTQKKHAGAIAHGGHQKSGPGPMARLYRIITGPDTMQEAGHITRANINPRSQGPAGTHYWQKQREPYDRLIKIGLLLNITMAALYIYPIYFPPPEWLYVLMGYIPSILYPFEFIQSVINAGLELFRVDYYTPGIEWAISFIMQGCIISCLMIQVIGTVNLLASRSRQGARLVLAGSGLLAWPGLIGFTGAVWAMELIKKDAPGSKGQRDKDYYRGDRMRDKRDAEGYIKDY